MVNILMHYKRKQEIKIQKLIRLNYLRSEQGLRSCFEEAGDERDREMELKAMKF